MADPTSLPQAAWNWLGALVGGVLTLFAAVIGYNFREVSNKGKDNSAAISALKVEAATFARMEDVNRDFVKREEFVAMEVQMAKLVSRRELIAYMRAQKDDQAKRDRQLELQHAENKEVMRDIKDASLLRDKHAQEFRAEMREAIGELALKVEKVSTIQEVKGALAGS